MAPNTYKNEEGELEVRGFHVTHVFDIGQTEGLEPPRLPSEGLTRLGDPTIDMALRAYTTKKGITLATDDAYLDKKGARGVYIHGASTRKPRILIHSGDFGAEWQATLLHELMHHEVYTNAKEAEKLPKQVHEVLAETGALMVMTALGYDIDPDSIQYICAYAEDKDVFRPLLDVADKFSKPILDHLETYVGGGQAASAEEELVA